MLTRFYPLYVVGPLAVAEGKRSRSGGGGGPGTRPCNACQRPQIFRLHLCFCTVNTAHAV